jgi:hypothetical protein
MSSSGGYIANNFRQGFRAEYLAKYIISEFGPCERVNPENDYGLDLIATLMERVGTAGFVSSMYGIQVKSGTAQFHYSGEQLIDWIKAYNIPIFMCRANRTDGRIKLYSTWTLHHLILDESSAAIREIDFVEDYGDDQALRMPQIADTNATVWLGPPIIDVSVAELGQRDHVDEIRKTLVEWVGVDARNYFRRNADIPVIFGYTTWTTNKSLDTSVRNFYGPHFYSASHTYNAMKLIQECATVIALNQGKDSQIAKDLADIIKRFGVDVQPFTKDVLGIEDH